MPLAVVRAASWPLVFGTGARQPSRDVTLPGRLRRMRRNGSDPVALTSARLFWPKLRKAVYPHGSVRVLSRRGTSPATTQGNGASWGEKPPAGGGARLG